MVKPAMPYLDIISDARTLAPHHPLACYQVSLAFSPTSIRKLNL